jgi:putative membrane protein
MESTGTGRAWATEHPRIVTAIVSVVGYAVVIGSFVGLVPFPQLQPETVTLFSHLIAIVNSFALAFLLAGVVFVGRGEIERHRRAMLGAFTLILAFLVLYVWKQAGGFTKGLVVLDGQFLAGYAGVISAAYLLMLAIHVLLSIVAVPFVVHAIVLGLTQPIETLSSTIHPTVGRVAVAAWGTSLALGILTYLMLHHVYTWERVRDAGLLLLIGTRPLRDSAPD